VLGAELGQVCHGGQSGGVIEQPDEVPRDEVQFGRQAGQRPTAGQIGLEQAYGPDDGGMGGSCFPGRGAAGLRDSLAELAEQQRKAADDVRAVQRGRAVPQRGVAVRC
jgi:hypothetical protein